MRFWERVAMVALLGLVPGLARAEERAVLFDSWPRGATVEIAGKPVGVTPLVRRFEEGFFKKPGTVWNRYLANPPAFALRLEGHALVEGSLGDGPFTWVSMNGANRFDYYVMRPAVFGILSEQPDSKPVPAPPPSDPVATVEALERLASLREQGVLTTDEFEKQKARILDAEPPAVAPEPAPAASPVSEVASGFRISEDSDATQLCARLWPFHAQVEKGAKLQARIAPLGRVLETTEAPLLSCFWSAPFPGIVAVRAFVECGPKDVEAACGMVKEQLTLDTPVPTVCTGRAGNDFVAVLSSGCVLRAGGGVSPQADSEPLRQAVYYSVLAGLTP